MLLLIEALNVPCAFIQRLGHTRSIQVWSAIAAICFIGALASVAFLSSTFTVNIIVFSLLFFGLLSNYIAGKLASRLKNAQNEMSISNLNMQHTIQNNTDDEMDHNQIHRAYSEVWHEQNPNIFSESNSEELLNTDQIETNINNQEQESQPESLVNVSQSTMTQEDEQEVVNHENRELEQMRIQSTGLSSLTERVRKSKKKLGSNRIHPGSTQQTDYNSILESIDQFYQNLEHQQNRSCIVC